MRFCPKCGNELQEGAKFCGSCGLNVEAAKQNAQQNSAQAPGQEQMQYSYHQAGAPVQPAKKSPVVIIVLVAIVVLAVMFGGGFLIANSILGGGESGEVEEIEVPESEVPETEAPEIEDVLEDTFDKGAVADGVYVNEWANMRFTVSDKFPEADTSVYDQYNNETTDCGFVSENLDTAQQFVLLYEYVDPDLGLDAEDYINIAVKRTETEMINSDLTYVTGDYFEYTIAGQQFLTVKITINDVVTEYICARQQDDRIIGMLLTSQYESDITGMLDSIQMVE